MSTALRERIPPPARPWVFAVEDTAAQITWRSLPVGPVRFRAADCTVEVVGDGGPGSVELTDLPAASTIELHVDGPAIPRSWARQTFETLAPPPGEELARFATVSDMHVGEIAFGIKSALLEHPVPAEAHPVRALAAALDAIAGWGADALVVKGDLTHAGRAKDWAQVGRLLAGARTPVHVMLGNHDHYGPAGEPVPTTALGPFGIEPVAGTGQVTVPGLNLVMVDTSIPGRHTGAVAHLQDDVIERLRASPLPAFLALHHHGERLGVPVFLPRGIPDTEMARFVDRVRWARPAAMIASGHTHRHRRRHVGSVVVSEVGSTKDFPGTWAGYVVHEGGIRQVVRRIAPPDLLRWTDLSARAGWRVGPVVTGSAHPPLLQPHLAALTRRS